MGTRTNRTATGVVKIANTLSEYKESRKSIRHKEDGCSCGGIKQFQRPVRER